MAHYVMSDLHGYYDKFIKMLSYIKFDSKQDVLYILGDVLDRGPDGIKILQYCMEKSNIFLIMGNHEEMLIDYIEGLTNVVDQNQYIETCYDTISSFSALSMKERTKIHKYLKSLPYDKELRVMGKDYYLVHGKPSNETDEALRKFEMTHKRIPKDDKNFKYQDKIVIFGHTPTIYYYNWRKDKEEGYKIYFAPNVIGIDCGAAWESEGGRLACLRLEDHRAYYITSGKEDTIVYDMEKAHADNEKEIPKKRKAKKYKKANLRTSRIAKKMKMNKILLEDTEEY